MQARPTSYMMMGSWERLRTVTGDENREDPSHPVFSCSTASSPLRTFPAQHAFQCLHAGAGTGFQYAAQEQQRICPQSQLSARERVSMRISVRVQTAHSPG